MRIKFNRRGFRELRTGAVNGILDSEAEAMASRANAVPSTTEPAADEPYYEVKDASDSDRARRRVVPTSARAARHEAKTQALQKAL